MPWIKNVVTNPAAGTIVIRFTVDTGATPHGGIVGVTGVYVASTATVTIVARRRNAAETQTYDNVFRVVCPANDSRLFRSPDDPFIANIGLPEAGSYEIVDFYVLSAVTGVVYVAVEVFGGPVNVVTGGVF